MLHYNINKVKQSLSTIRSFFGAENMSVEQYVKNIATRFKEDSLFQNSVYLMASTMAMSLFGFAFWIITTRLYSASQIGFATALISVTILLSTFSLFGFNTSLIRYLPKSEKPNSIINTSLIVVAFITIIISTIYVLGIGYIAPQFNLLRKIPLYGIFFVIIMVMVSINMLTDSIFIAYRASKYNFIEYVSFGLAKILLPLLLIGLGTYGIFFSYTGSVLVAMIITFYYLIKKFNYRPQLVIEKDVIKHIGGFSLGNYAATFIADFPGLILPTLIVIRIGASQSAYFYIASAIAALLYGIPQAMAQSLLAEGAHNEKEMGKFVKSASKLIGSILLFGVLAFIVLSKYVLSIFGKEYAVNSRALLIIMAITSFFVAINVICNTVLRIQNRVKALVIISTGYAIVTVLLIVLLLHNGIIGAGWALFLGQVFMSIEFGVLFFSKTIKKILYWSIGKRNWRTFEYFDPCWNNRIQEMAAYIPAGASVLDLGCGKMWLQQYLHDSPYYPVDYTDRGAGTIVCDFNIRQFPEQHADVAFVSGTLEYIHDSKWFVSCISKNCDQCVISYCLKEYYPDQTFRRKQSWVNSFSRDEIIQMFSDAGFQLNAESDAIEKNIIFNFIKVSA